MELYNGSDERNNCGISMQCIGYSRWVVHLCGRWQVLRHGALDMADSFPAMRLAQCDFRFDLFYSFSFVPSLSNLLMKTC